MRIALLYEHPSWSTGLIARAEARGLEITTFDVGAFDYDANIHTFDLWVNRVNAMPSNGRPISIVAATGHLLLSLEMHGQRIVNGSQTHRVGGSKLAQGALFTRLGLATPASIGIYEADQAAEAAMRLGFPVLTKPNVGGSGSGIVRHDTIGELEQAISSGAVDLGIDGTGLVQRIIESADGLIHRVEMLRSEFFYGTEQAVRPDAFNYCAVDGCSVDSEEEEEDSPVGGVASAISLFSPPDEIIEQAAAVMAAAQTDVGGVEYIIDAATGEPTFYDFNPYSNFISGFDDALGFNPIDRYLDFLLAAPND